MLTVNKAWITVAIMVTGIMLPTNAVEMTGTVLTEFTRKANLRHFFVPREVVPRTMTAKMPTFDWADNPVKDHFRRGLTKQPECMNSGQS
jgi:hypothetical protein